MNDLERFAIAQAMYSHLAEQIKTKTVGNLREIADQKAVDDFFATGATTIPVRIGDEVDADGKIVAAGEVVGTINVKTHSGYTITDIQAWRDWAEENGVTEEVEVVNPDFDWQTWAMSDPDYYSKRQWIRENIPGFFRKEKDTLEWWKDLVDHQGSQCFERDSGEVLPFLEWRTDVVGTSISGFKWENPPKKYRAIRDVLPLAGIQGGESLKQLMGGE